MSLALLGMSLRLASRSVREKAFLSTTFPDGAQKVASENMTDIGSQPTLVRTHYTGNGSNPWSDSVTDQRGQPVVLCFCRGEGLSPGSHDVDTPLRWWQLPPSEPRHS